MNTLQTLCKFLAKYGAGSRSRTRDLLITKKKHLVINSATYTPQILQANPLSLLLKSNAKTSTPPREAVLCMEER